MKKVVEQKSQFASGVLMNSGDLNCDGFPDLLYKYTTLSGAKSISIEFGTKDGFQGNGARSIKIMNSEIDGGIDGAIPSLNQYVSGIKIIPDINGDGCADLIVSLMYLKNSGVVTATDAAYVIFGDKGFDKFEDIDISKVAMPRGFLIAEANPATGRIVSYQVNGLGDINKDGSNDFSITRDDAFSYIIFGHDKNNPFTDLKLDGNAKGLFKVDNASNAVGIGDINGASYDDFAISIGTDVYVMYGKRAHVVEFQLEDARSPFGFKIFGNKLY